MVREVVVIFDRVEGCWFAEETEMMDGDRVGQQDLEGFQHAEARTKNWDEGDVWSRGFGCVGVIQGGFSLETVGTC